MVSLLVAFIAGFLVDMGWTLYVRAVADGDPSRAAAYSMVVGGLGAAGLLVVVRDGWAIVPYVIGLGIGSYVAVRWGSR